MNISSHVSSRQLLLVSLCLSLLTEDWSSFQVFTVDDVNQKDSASCQSTACTNEYQVAWKQVFSLWIQNVKTSSLFYYIEAENSLVR